MPVRDVLTTTGEGERVVPAPLRYRPMAYPAGSHAALKVSAAYRNYRQLRELDEQQRDAGETLGRLVVFEDEELEHPYQVVRVSAGEATVVFCQNVRGYHDQPHRYLGERATLPRRVVEELIAQRDVREHIEACDRLRD